MFLEIDDLKKHLNVDHDEDDAYIGDLCEVAEDAVETYLQRPLTDFVDPTRFPQAIKPAIRHAIRLLVGTWYANRESVSYATGMHELPNGVSALLTPLKKF